MWRRFHSGRFSHPTWWNNVFNGQPWWWWWYEDPIYANSLIVKYPGYCEWCAVCDNLDPDGSSAMCANCEANCPYGSLKPYGL
jgi:hypothetical protein